jgi:acetylornithine/N-succinyldiaminopimelate aminotransferase
LSQLALERAWGRSTLIAMVHAANTASLAFEGTIAQNREAPMLTNAEIAAIARRHLYQNYRPLPVVFSRGKGCELYDVEGKRWLDLCAGVAVCSIGHSHPALTRVLAEQAGTLMHVSNYFLNEPNVLAAAELCRRTGMDRAMFTNSGAEANEAMLKLARRYFYGLGQKSRVRVIAFENAFHGRTLGALSMTGTAKYREGFGEMPGVTHVPYGDLDAVKRAMGEDVAAINVEPLQGEGGVMPAPPGFLRGLREVCDRVGALLMVDEVQTGVGRTGHFLAIEASGVGAHGELAVTPDAIALAKGLGGGFPVGVMLTREKFALALPPGTHGTTFGGNALASAAVLATLKVLDDEKLVSGAREKGQKLGAMLATLAGDFPDVCELARGAGLLWGLVLREGFVARDVLPIVLEHGVLLTAAGDRILRFSPPLVVSVAQLEEGVGAVRKVVERLSASRS